MLRPGLVAIDGTKLTANASRAANRTVAQLAEAILAEAAATDAAEDRRDSVAAEADLEPPAVLRNGHGRRDRLRALLQEMEDETSEKSYDAHMAKREEIEQATGKPIRGRRPSPQALTHKSRSHANVSDPDSRLLKTKDGYAQGYNAQAVATEQQFVVAAEVTNIAHDAPAYLPIDRCGQTKPARRR